MFKVKNKDTRKTLTLNYFAPFPSFPIVDFNR